MYNIFFTPVVFLALFPTDVTHFDAYASSLLALFNMLKLF